MEQKNGTTRTRKTMTTPKQTPAQLLRRAEKAERLLEAEKTLNDKHFKNYREVLHEVVELKMRLEAIEKALRGGMTNQITESTCSYV